MYSTHFFQLPKCPLHPSLILLIFVFSQLSTLQSNSCLMNGELMPEVWSEQLTTELTETPAVCLFVLRLKAAKHAHTQTEHLYHWAQGTSMVMERVLAQRRAKVQVAPQGGELSGPLLNISTTGDRFRATFSNACVFKTKRSTFPLVQTWPWPRMCAGT